MANHLKLFVPTQQFSDVECIEPFSSGAIVTFKTRNDAELASKQIANINFKKDTALTFVWFDENKVKSEKNIASLASKVSKASKTTEASIDGSKEVSLHFDLILNFFI